MTRITPPTVAATRTFLIATVLLLACAHAPVARQRNLSGLWEGNCVWMAGPPGKTAFRSNLRFVLSMVHNGAELIGTGSVARADRPERRSLPVNVYGTVEGDRVHLRMVFRPGLDDMGFDGSVRGRDGMNGLVYNATAMDWGRWPRKNPIKLKRVGRAHVDPLYPPEWPRPPKQRPAGTGAGASDGASAAWP